MASMHGFMQSKIVVLNTANFDRVLNRFQFTFKVRWNNINLYDLI